MGQLRQTSSANAEQCRQITAGSGSSFYYAFLFLPRERREALYAVYAFCRLVDDAADDAGSAAEARERLDEWRRELDAIFDGKRAPQHPVAVELLRSVRRFPIRREDMEAVIEGCEWDGNRNRYATWGELEAYCWRVASAVGLMCIEIFGYRSPRAREYARDLGVALQLTNILRDVAEDARRGRLYLPGEDLESFGVVEADLLGGRRTPEVKRLLRFEAGRAEGYYLRARATIGDAERSRLVVAEIMGDIYHALLDRLVTLDFPDGEAARLTTARKAAIALRRFAASRLS